MKKFIALLCAMCLLMLPILSACTPTNGNEDSSTESPIEDTSATDDTTQAEDDTTEDDKWPTETSDPEVVTLVSGDVRVVIYSETLLRVEVAKNGTFEDHPTFAVPGRENFAGIAPEHVIQTEENGIVTLETPRFTVSVNKELTAKSGVQPISAVTVVDPDGESLWLYTDTHTDALYLPEPYKTPDSWVFNDVRRLVKAEDPYTPNGEENNGWELSVNVRDYYIFVPMGDAAQLRYDFNKLTGECEMVPIKTLGLWFSRFAELGEQDFYNVINEYYDRGFPLDVVVVDTHWKQGFSTGYDVNTALFPDIERFFDNAEEMGVLTLLNDHVRDYSGSMLDADQLNWFNTNLQLKLEQGMSAWWYDRNWNYHLESPFRGYHGDLLGQDMYYTITDAINGNNRTWMLSNVYWINSYAVTEAPHVSSHRYSLQWTGDISCGADALRTELEHAVYAGAAAAMPYIISDIGGHMGNPEEDLYIRWTQYGSLSSIMRYHANGYDRSPWVTSELAETIAREYINMRYRLMPLYYSLARANYDTGMPIMKRLDFVYPQYEEARANDQYLLGDNILIAPITSNAASTSAAIPTDWVTAANGENGWDAEYYSNKNLYGTPTYTQIDKEIAINWGVYAPEGPKVMPADGFGVRWSGTVTNKLDVPVGLATLSDDGIRVYVDGELIVDIWEDGATPTIANKEFLIQPGQTCDIIVEYYDNTGDAKIQLSYYPFLSPDKDQYLDYRDVFIPDGTWMDVWTGKTYTGPQTITVGHTEYTSPIFVKLGSFTVLADNQQNLNTEDWDKLAIDVYAGEGSFAYELYEDDGKTEDYMDGICRRTDISMVTEGKTTTMKIGKAMGNYTTSFDQRTYTLRIHETDGYSVKDIKVNGEYVDMMFLEQAEAYTADGGSPFSFDGAACDTDVTLVTFTAALDTGAEIVITYN